MARPFKQQPVRRPAPVKQIETVGAVESTQPKQRLHKLLALSGLGSRREMEALIASGRITINGVTVSVRPDFLLTFSKKGRTFSGAIKLHFIKSADSALQRKGAEFVTVLLHEWLTQFGPRGCMPSHAHCLSIDVFRRSIVPAPKATSRRWGEIVAACEEVRLRWPHL